MNQDLALMRKGWAKAQAMRVAARSVAPRCTNTVEGYLAMGKGRTRVRADRICGASTIQNDVERERRVYWCPDCATYPWGSGYNCPDDIPERAWPV